MRTIIGARNTIDGSNRIWTPLNLFRANVTVLCDSTLVLTSSPRPFNSTIETTIPICSDLIRFNPQNWIWSIDYMTNSNSILNTYQGCVETNELTSTTQKSQRTGGRRKGKPMKWNEWVAFGSTAGAWLSRFLKPGHTNIPPPPPLTPPPPPPPRRTEFFGPLHCRVYNAWRPRRR